VRASAGSAAESRRKPSSSSRAPSTSVSASSVAERGSPSKNASSPAVVGELAFFDGEPRSATLEALTDVEGARLDEDGFQRLSAAEPALARTMLLELGRVLAGRLRRASELITDLRE